MSERVSAIDLLVQAGGDVRLGSMFAAGPYVVFLTGWRPGAQSAGSIPALEGGLRLRFMP